MSSPTQFALFDTPVGTCSVVWEGDVVLGLRLPARTAAATRAAVVRQYSGAKEAKATGIGRETIDRVLALLSGTEVTLEDIVLDMRNIPEFYRRVYEVSRRIAPGTTRTYGEVAQLLSSPGSARAVGQALGRNPFAIIVPCHRVIAAGGKLGGFSARGGVATKRRLLELEGMQLQQLHLALRSTVTRSD